MRIASEILKFCGIVLGLGLIFAWLGVYNTGRLPFYKSVVFWSSTMAVGLGASLLISPYIWGPRFEKMAAIFKIAIAAALISAPVTLVLVIFFNSAPWQPIYLLIQYGYVLVISLIVTSAAYGFDLLKEQQVAADDVSDPIASFLERLPVKFRTADLYAISSEDHYLRVHTSLGEELILMRLADAVRELSHVDGLQVHRSWWVAKAGVTDEKKADGRNFLILPTGTEVPVSRSYRAKAKDVGLIR